MGRNAKIKSLRARTPSLFTSMSPISSKPLTSRNRVLRVLLEYAVAILGETSVSLEMGILSARSLYFEHVLGRMNSIISLSTKASVEESWS